MKKKLPLRFGRNEIAGAFGDIGTDIPLIVLLILKCDLDARSVLILFGACQVFAGIAYRLPIPVQPLKAMAAIAIAEGLSGEVLAGGGLVIGLIMLILSVTGGLGLIWRVTPKPVVRGLQFGLGLKLAMLALQEYIPHDGMEGYALGAAAFGIVVLLHGSRKYPAALFVLGLGVIYALVMKDGADKVKPALDASLPTLRIPSLKNLLTGLWVLAIPQLPLSLGNAVLATRQTVGDLFGRKVSVRKLGLTYSACNLVAPLLGGIPVCHGSGGVAGHYTFGARTGGSVIIYGVAFLGCGLLFGRSFPELIDVFPRALLGVLLLFESIAIMRLSRDMAGTSRDFTLVLTVGLLAAALPYGFCVSMIVGILLYHWVHRKARKDKQTDRGNAPVHETKESSDA